MKNLKIWVLAASVTLIASAAASAQDYAEYYKYAEEAREMSMLFRGKQGITYQFLHNGTCYWYSRTFTLGDVLYNGKLYRDVYTNINAHTQELQVKQSPDLMAVLADRDYVDWFTMDSKMYVNLAKRGVEDASEGFYEVVYEGGSALYKRVEKIIRTDPNNKNGAAIGYDDPNYNDKVFDYFANRVQYFFLKDGEWRQVKSLSNILKSFPENKKEVKRFIKSQGLDMRNFEAAAATVLNYIDNEKK